MVQWYTDINRQPGTINKLLGSIADIPKKTKTANHLQHFNW